MDTCTGHTTTNYMTLMIQSTWHPLLRTGKYCASSFTVCISLLIETTAFRL